MLYLRATTSGRKGDAALEAAGLGVGEVLESKTTVDLPWRLERGTRTRFSSHSPIPNTATLPDGIRDDHANQAATWARVLAWFRGGEPALLERTKGRGKVLWFTSACDRAWSDWPRGNAYPPMLHQMVAYVSGLWPTGAGSASAIAGDERQPGVVESDGLVNVVNVDPLESDTPPCAPKEFADRFGFQLPVYGRTPTRVRRVGGRGDDRLRNDELWPWVALTVDSAFLLWRTFFANRTAA